MDAEFDFAGIEAELASRGFTEMYGAGMWALKPGGLIVDTNGQPASVIPHINASYDNIHGFARTVPQLNALLQQHLA
jgi:hypothetical protein